MMRRNPIASAIRFWSVAKGFSTDQIRREMERPVAIALVGSAADQDRVIGRLSREPGVASSTPVDLSALVARFDSPQAARESGRTIIFDSGDAAARTDQDFAVLLNNIVSQNVDIRVALAANVPAFRPVVIGQLIAEAAKENARVAALSALPGVIPLTDWLVPATAAGDMFLLTKNQITLLLRISACYGLAPDVKTRLRELLPVVGSAFGWRAIARELIGLVPGGVGLVVKASVAYAATLAVGRAAAYYYASGGHRLSAADMHRFYRQSTADAIEKVRALLPFAKK